MAKDLNKFFKELSNLDVDNLTPEKIEECFEVLQITELTYENIPAEWQETKRNFFYNEFEPIAEFCKKIKKKLKK